jgi:hypothetical protein
VASIHKQSGRAFWFASYRDASGKQHFVSTKIRHAPLGHDGKERSTNAAKNRRLALDMAIRLEEAERGNATEAHLRKVLADVSERVNQRRLEFKTADAGVVGSQNDHQIAVLAGRKLQNLLAGEHQEI